MPAGPTPNLDIDRMDEGESGVVRFNEALDSLDCVVQLSVINQTTTAQPGSPNEGDRYLIAATATGADWTGHDNEVGCFVNSQWVFLVPVEGWLMYDETLDTLFSYDGAVWNAEGGAGGAAPSNAEYVTIGAEAGLTQERALTGTADQIIVTDNTTTVDLSLPTTLNNVRFIVPGTGAMQPPIGTTVQRPDAPVDGDMRYNSTDGFFEVREGGAWIRPSQTGGGTGAPTDAEYVVITDNGGLSEDRVLTGTPDQIEIVDNSTSVDLKFPDTSVSVSHDIPGTGQMILPQGTDAERHTVPVNGMFRYNSEFDFFEYYENGSWIRPSQVPVGGGGGPFLVMKTEELPVTTIDGTNGPVLDPVLKFTPAINTNYRFLFDLWINIGASALLAVVNGPILTPLQNLSQMAMTWKDASDLTEDLSPIHVFGMDMVAVVSLVDDYHIQISGYFLNQLDISDLQMTYNRISGAGSVTVHKGSTLTVWTF